MAGSDRTPEVSQLITQMYTSIMEVILQSRCPTSAAFGDQPSSSSADAHSLQSSGFNLVMGRLSPGTKKTEPWCIGVCDPMVIDILYLQRGVKGAFGPRLMQNAAKIPAQGSLKVALEASGLENAILLERWSVEFIQRKSGSSNKSEREVGHLQLHKGIIGRYLRGAQDNQYRVAPAGTHQSVGALGKDENEAAQVFLRKNFSIVLRSLYCAARLLPAQNLSRLLSTTDDSMSRLAYRIATTPPPLLQSDKKDMTLFRFPAFDCGCGQLRMAVAYQRTVPSLELKVPTLPRQIIMDYVGKADYHQLKQAATEKVAHVHSLPSARCLSSIKTSNQQVNQPATKERASKSGQSWALVQPHDFSPIVPDTFDCPFAINDVHDRTDATKLVSVKSDIGVQPQEDASSRLLLAILRQSEPLRGARENLVSHEPRRTAMDALKELKVYIDVKDELLSKCI